MTTEDSMEYRVLCDNLSRFSIELNKAASLSDVQLVLQNNIHLLFDCYAYRITYFQQNNFICYTITSETPTVVTGTYQLLWDVEKLLFYEGMPLQLNAGEHKAILQRIPLKNEIEKLWGWKLSYGDDAGILLTVMIDKERSFSRKRIPLLKMICEMLFTKMQLVLLLQSLQKNEADLTAKNRQLEASHVVISELMAIQEKIINKRTQELSLLNEHLNDIIQFNSHTIQEPLTRIMGLIELKPLISDDEFFKSCWPMIVTSIYDLDNRLKDVIEKLEKLN